MKTGQFRMRQCVVEGVEAVEADTAHSFGRHTHDQFGIGVIIRGAQTSASGRGPVEAGPGDMITVNPGEVHDGHPIGPEGRSWRMLYFDPGVIAQAVLDIGEGRPEDFVFSRPVMNDGDASRRLLPVYAAMTQMRETLAPETGFLQLVASLMDRQSVSRFVPPSINQAKALLDDDPAAATSLSDLAAASGLSRFQVVRGFSQATGMTPHAYLVQRRIGAVRRLIVKGASLADAAFASGFADQSHMTRAFVRAYGMTPGAYALAQN
ncbi:AraC family transcriptional regulator [Rhizobium sp. PL01]|uniref:AraC family transcriptional regulator n=1 Tax=Rhizobium sp. PL01 TaxID=3085631 RepID=UPI002981F831|nr:AraC family transcriptional regulator [Rhizobium sp. PL01]MDW5316449.1 AraC family transcriptional regulator [Rhizobium sp. PL01]